ncbi:MAG TPA: hypothetical protein VIJ52_04110 [Pseudolabrys sp.]
MKTFLILAGLPQPIFDLVRSTPERKLVPNGQLIRSPMPVAGYNDRYAAILIKAAHERLVLEREEEESSIVLAYVAHPGDATQKFVGSFFPFALPIPLRPFSPRAGWG